MGGSSNLWPLQLYILSTTASLTPGQCYTEFNEGAFMNEYSWSYRQQLRTRVRKSLNAPGLHVHCHLVSFRNPLVSATSSDFSIQAVIFHLWLSQRSHSGQKRYQGVSKNQYAAYLPESCSVVLITVTMKLVLQEPSEMAYSQDQYVCTHYKHAGMKFSFESIKCLFVQALGSCTHFKHSVQTLHLRSVGTGK